MPIKIRALILRMKLLELAFKSSFYEKENKGLIMIELAEVYTLVNNFFYENPHFV